MDCVSKVHHVARGFSPAWGYLKGEHHLGWHNLKRVVPGVTLPAEAKQASSAGLK